MFDSIHDPKKLAEIACEIRKDIIEMLYEAGSGHPGGSLSAADIVTTLCFSIMRHDPKQPLWPERDRLIMSKGHAIPVWYAALANAGYLERKELVDLRKLGSRLQGHPDRVRFPGIEASTGSLGQGLSIALGMAMASKMDGAPYRVYTVMGDGECQEGQIWEAAMAAGKFGMDTLCATLDYNKGQIDGFVKDVMPLEPVADKWRAFHWHVIEVNGHDIPALQAAYKEATQTKGKPTLVLADTIKGKGVDFMENEIGWHGKAPSQEERDRAIAGLSA